jgi:hypothetical protein
MRARDSSVSVLTRLQAGVMLVSFGQRNWSNIQSSRRALGPTQLPTQLISSTSSLDCGPGSSVSIATDYGLDGPEIEPRWGRDFSPVQTSTGAHPTSCTMGTGSFLGVKFGRGVLLTTHRLLTPRSWKSRAIPQPPSGPQPGLLRGYYFLGLVTYCVGTAFSNTVLKER